MPPPPPPPAYNVPDESPNSLVVVPCPFTLLHIVEVVEYEILAILVSPLVA